jgi:hypothetical protein
MGGEGEAVRPRFFLEAGLRGCTLLCQGRAWHLMLGMRVTRWRVVSYHGFVQRELEGNRGFEFDERWPFA